MPGAHWLKTSAASGHGSSGGAAFDATGALVGVDSAGSVEQGGTEGTFAFLRPIEEAQGLIQRALATVRSTPAPTTTSVVTTTQPTIAPATTVTTPPTAAPAATVVPTTTPPTTAPAQPSAGTYTVLLGDTLYGIGRAFHTTVDALRAVNGSAVDVIVDHEQILLPAGAHPLLASEVTTVPYTVAGGDTIIGIAKQFKVTPAVLLAVNGKLTSPDSLVAGQVLLIPS